MAKKRITKDEDHAAAVLSEAANAAVVVRGMVAVASNWLGGSKFPDLFQRASDLAGDLRAESAKLWRVS